MDFAAEMLLNYDVGVWQVFPIWTASIRPSASNGWTPSGLAGSLVFPPKGVDILAPSEERPEEGDLLLPR
jgi:hypothetical protein